jgi:acyl-coenzyme A synthetase/AMP-(fatty) acid ligase
VTRADSLPLFSHRHPDNAIAWRNGRAVSAREFVHDIRALTVLLGRQRYILNLCEDRYRFMVAFGAALMNGQTTLLPQNRTEKALNQIIAVHPDVVCVVDAPTAPIGADVLVFPDALRSSTLHWSVPRIAHDQIAAVVFTSGSTGEPTPHAKPWGKLVAGAFSGAEALAVAPGSSFVGTVPPQHMYGLEATVLLPLQTGGAVHSGRPLLPRDVQAALEELPAPRVLATTPIHIRACLESAACLVPIDLIVSSAAPLATALATRAETHYGTRLTEIYGCTEAGMIAVRRTSQSEIWRTLRGTHVSEENGGWTFRGDHIDGVVRSNDVLGLLGAREFRLEGRSADLVNVAGKRSSLADLNHKLTEIAGVLDGAFYARDAESGRAGRLMAFVVAPELSEGEILAALRRSIDPVFVPRPLVKMDSLPRLASGKLPHAALEALAARSIGRSRGK